MLPGNSGIGDLGKAAYNFVDYLAETGIDIWQLLPLNPLGYGNSPYQCYSLFARDEIYIDIKVPLEIKNNRVNYDEVRKFKQRYLKIMFKNFDINNERYQNFLKDNPWVEEYAIFISFKKLNRNKAWMEWDSKFINYPECKFDLSKYSKQIEFEKYLQYLFYTQWRRLKKYANKKGIELMGDLPFYPGLDSADVFFNKQLFAIEDNIVKEVGGVPPDYFSATGQLWGNPVYHLINNILDDFSYFSRRSQAMAKLFDIIRLDHFIGYENFYKINAGKSNAIEGEWVKNDHRMLESVVKYASDAKVEFIAEDLGMISPEVRRLQAKFKLKGMSVLQFDFRFNGAKKFMVTRKKVFYPGTHDNQSMISWYNSLSVENREIFDHYLLRRVTNDNLDLTQKIIAFYTKANRHGYSIISIIDLLGLDDEARINSPGVISDLNWSYNLGNFKKLNAVKDYLKKLVDRAIEVAESEQED